jgi:hypothetical protein
MTGVADEYQGALYACNSRIIGVSKRNISSLLKALDCKIRNTPATRGCRSQRKQGCNRCIRDCFIPLRSAGNIRLSFALALSRKVKSKIFLGLPDDPPLPLGRAFLRHWPEASLGEVSPMQPSGGPHSVRRDALPQVKSCIKLSHALFVAEIPASDEFL